MTTKILDSHAVITFLEDEPGASIVQDLILKAEESKVKLAMSVVNLGEVWATVAQATSSSIADRYVQEIQGLAIEIVDANWEITQSAAKYNTKNGISYPSCFAVAIAKKRRGEIVTGNPEFKVLEKEVKILWIGETSNG